MSKNTFFLLFFAFIFFPLSGNAQLIEGICGTDHTELITERLLKNKEALKRGQVQRRNAISYIPIHFIVVGKADGSDRVKLSRILDQIDALNEDFLDSEFQFYLEGDIKFLDNNIVYDSQTSFAALSKMEEQKSRSAMNIFLVNTAKHSSGSSDGVILGYYSSLRDWLVIRNDNVNRASGTLSHEIGHFFSLNHTHSGWESKSWDHSNPSPTQVGFTSPGNIATERQDGSNCQTSGDFICDTPPDYNFGFGWIKDGDRCAAYDGGVKDPNGDVVDPMENNFMGYFISCSDYEFTDGQNSVMLADYNSNGRTYLRKTYTPNLNEVTTKPALVEPIAGETTEGYNRVDLTWNAVPQADRYLVQVDRLPDFSFELREQIVNDPSAIIRDLDPNKNYYWRVRPFNEYDTDALFSNSERFKTGTDLVSTNNIDGVNNWFITPNPLAEKNNVNLVLDSEVTFDAAVKIYNITGQEVQAIDNQGFGVGRNTLSLDTAPLSKGIYIVTIQTGNAVLNRRLVIQ